MKIKRYNSFLESASSGCKAGDRIELIEMDDMQAVEAGTKGTVDHVDSIGQIHVKWDNGRTLAIVPEIDKFIIINE